jgi:23S rRNA U2552 (ribose-2'-O)-methylase RlmE/FtsJ
MELLRCESTIERIAETYNKVAKTANDVHTADKRALEDARQKAQDEKVVLNDMAYVINGVRNTNAAAKLRILMSACEERREMLDKNGERIEEAWRYSLKEAEKYTQVIEGGRQQIRVLKLIAQAAGIGQRDIS